MRKIAIAIAIAIGLMAVVGLTYYTKQTLSKTKYENTEKVLRVSFSNNTTESEIKVIAEDIKRTKGYTMDYSETTFGPDGKIESLSIKVIDKNGMERGSCSIDATFIITDFGFMFDYNEDAEIAYQFGGLGL